MTDQTLQSSPTTQRKSVLIDTIQTVTGNTFSAMILEGQGQWRLSSCLTAAPTAGPSSQVLQQVADMIGPKEKIFRVNIAIEQELADSYEIQGTPTLIMFLHGREVGRVEGPHPTVSSVLKVITQPFES